MKQIQPFNVWRDGKNVEATFLSATAQDNLKDAASIYYILYSGTEWPEQSLINSGIAISGEDYENWNAEPDMNTWLYNWLANKLNITIIGDFVPTPPEMINIESVEAESNI